MHLLVLAPSVSDSQGLLPGLPWVQGPSAWFLLCRFPRRVITDGSSSTHTPQSWAFSVAPFPISQTAEPSSLSLHQGRVERSAMSAVCPVPPPCPKVRPAAGETQLPRGRPAAGPMAASTAPGSGYFPARPTGGWGFARVCTQLRPEPQDPVASCPHQQVHGLVEGSRTASRRERRRRPRSQLGCATPAGSAEVCWLCLFKTF